MELSLKPCVSVGWIQDGRGSWVGDEVQHGKGRGVCVFNIVMSSSLLLLMFFMQTHKKFWTCWFEIAFVSSLVRSHASFLLMGWIFPFWPYSFCKSGCFALEHWARDLGGAFFVSFSGCFGGNGGMSSSWSIELAPPRLNGDGERGDLEGREDGLGDDGGGCGGSLGGFDPSFWGIMI
jgi:hypothetical protein